MLFTLPYVATNAAVWWHLREFSSKFFIEDEYAALKLTRQAGYNIDDYIKSRERKVEAGQQEMREVSKRLLHNFRQRM